MWNTFEKKDIYTPKKIMCIGATVSALQKFILNAILVRI